MKSALLVLVAFTASLVLGQTLVDITASFPNGAAGNGTIWYQSDTNYPAFSFGNVYNPITVSIIYEIGATNYDASICLNFNELNYPIEGKNLLSNCPAGAYGTASNTSTEDLSSLSAAYKNNNLYASSKSKFISSRLAMAETDGTTGTYTTETTTAQIYVKPSNNAGAFIVSIPDSEEIQAFNVFFTGKQCDSSDYYPVGTDGACQTIDPAPATKSATLNPGAWQYYQVPITVAANSLAVSVNGTNDGIQLFVQRDYYPTADWFLNTDNQIDDDDGDITATVLSPQVGQTYFIGIYNSDTEDSQTFYFNYSLSAACVAPTFGYNCQHSSANTSSPLGGALPFSATVVQGASPNNGTAKSYDFSDDDDTYTSDYAYFYLTDYPNYSTPYYIRVSAANNDPNDENGAPGLFAAQGYYPSAQSNVYNVSTLGDVTHQIVIKIDEDDLQASNDGNGTLPVDKTWYFSVQLPVDFSVWVGVNCASNCSNGKHGDCYCGNQTCASLTTNGTNLAPMYNRTFFLQDSAGACTCNDDDYEKSFDCTERSNGNSVLYIVLIAVGGFIVLAVAIGVPLYCFIANRKENDYDRV